MNLRLIAMLVVFLITATAIAQQKSDADQLKVDSKRLDELEKVFASTPQFGEHFWRASKRLADERGPAIIDAVMVRSRKWQGEEGLIYVPLVALLPRDKAIAVLHSYQHGKRE